MKLPGSAVPEYYFSPLLSLASSLVQMDYKITIFPKKKLCNIFIRRYFTLFQYHFVTSGLKWRDSAEIKLSTLLWYLTTFEIHI